MMAASTENSMIVRRIRAFARRGALPHALILSGTGDRVSAARYAAEPGLQPEEELFRYMVHGLTHLHGYLDYEPADREALFAVQEPLGARFFPK